MNYTPREWTEASAQLKCLECGQVIQRNFSITEWFHGDWIKLEQAAAAEQYAQAHKCGQRPITTEEAKVIMHLYRENNPDLSFEEECKVYNEIMQNQTCL